MEHLVALGAGLAAGLAVAIPLGAIGVLLVQEGTTRGWRRGAPAAAAVATVDTAYSLGAVVAGAALAPLVEGISPWPQVVGGLLLVALAARGLLRLRSSSSASPNRAGADVATGRAWGRFALFVGLTAVNPATLVSFAAVVTGLASVVGSVGTGALFVVGVAAASSAWQLLLVALGAFLGWRGGTRARLVTSVVGNGVVALLGAGLLAGALA